VSYLKARPEKTIRFDQYYAPLANAPDRPYVRWPRKTNPLQLAAISAWHKTNGRGFRENLGWHTLFGVTKPETARIHLSELPRLGILEQVWVINDEESEFLGYIWLINPIKKEKPRKTRKG